MSDLRQTARIAQEWMEYWLRGAHLTCEDHPRLEDDVDALRAALAQPEQLVVGGGDLPTLTKWTPQRKPLTDEEVDTLSRTMVKGGKSVNWLCRAIEKAHGIGDK